MIVGMITPLSLEGRVIRLRPLAVTDIPELCRIGLDPALWRSTTIEVKSPPEMEAYVATALTAQAAGTARPFAIVDRATNRLIGTTRFHSIVPEHKRLEIGFTWIAVPWQRTAANTEAKFLMLQHGFEAMGCVRVEFRADAENEQSRRALIRIGAREEGILRRYRISARRGIRDLAVYSIVDLDWPDLRENLRGRLLY